MSPEAIGARNPRLRRLRQLVGRSKARSEQRAFVIDGPRLLLDAVRSGLEIQEIFAAPGALADSELSGEISGQLSGVATFEVDPSVLSSLLDPVNPRPVAAVAAMPEWSSDELLADDRPVLVAVELGDPGNLGSVIRTAEAAGLAGLIVAGDSVDRFSPKVVRASAGSLFRLPVIGRRDAQATVGELRDRGRLVVAAVVDQGARPYEDEDLGDAAILIGNEPHGLAEEVIDLVDRPVTIPMAPGVESLNVAAAASVLCFEAARQRRAAARRGRNPVDSHRIPAHRVHNDSVASE